MVDSEVITLFYAYYILNYLQAYLTQQRAPFHSPIFHDKLDSRRIK